MPGVMIGGRPAPDSSDATLEAVSGSFSTTGATQATIHDVLDARVGSRYGTGLRPGHEFHVGRAISRLPIGSALAATAT